MKFEYMSLLFEWNCALEQKIEVRVRIHQMAQFWHFIDFMSWFTVAFAVIQKRL